MHYEFNIIAQAFGGGLVGLLGWLSLCLLMIFGLIVVARRITFHQNDLAPTFFAAAHLQLLFFILCCGIYATFIDACCCGGLLSLGTGLFSFSVGIGLTAATVLTVALATGTRPVMPFWDCLCFLVLAVDVAMLTGGGLMVLFLAK